MLRDKIEQEITIDAPVERVWAVITEAEHVGKWFADQGADVDLQPGGAMVLRWKEYGSTHARVEQVEAPHFFSYRWALPSANPSGEAPRDDNSTLVEFTLRPEGGGTRLRVVETGFASLSASDEEKVKRVEENTQGWNSELNELRDYAQKLAA